MSVTLKELAEATSAMRKAQKEYFRLRTNPKLNEAKKAEAEVDRLLTLLAPAFVNVRVNLNDQPKVAGQQGGLFT